MPRYTPTGRLTRDEPNIQNIPIRTSEGAAIRAAFEGKIDSNHPNRTTSNINRRIRRHIAAAGYSKEQIDAGLSYAREHGDYTAREGYILAMSRILYTDWQLADGARFSVEVGYGPK